MDDPDDLMPITELAAKIRQSVENTKVLRRQHGWPSVKIGKSILFTREQVEQILAAHTVKPVKSTKPAPGPIAGQTKRSAGRAS